MLRALGSASCDIIHETGGTSFYGYWVLHLVTTHTRQGVRFVTICYGHWVLRLVMSHARQGFTICAGHWVLRLVISHTRQGVRFVTGIGFYVL